MEVIKSILNLFTNKIQKKTVRYFSTYLDRWGFTINEVQYFKSSLVEFTNKHCLIVIYDDYRNSEISIVIYNLSDGKILIDSGLFVDDIVRQTSAFDFNNYDLHDIDAIFENYKIFFDGKLSSTST